MNESTDNERMRREIIDEVGALLREHLAAHAWARLLVEVVVAPEGEPLVAEMDVEGILGDEAPVDAAFADEAIVRPLLPVLAKATEALCNIENVEIDDVRGGTFLRQSDDGFEWLPGLVHMPSPALVAAWDAAETRLRDLQAGLESRFGLRSVEGVDVDVEHERIVFTAPGRAPVGARATLIGSYSRASRTWAWGAQNHRLPAPVRAASAALVDAIEDRAIGELSSPIFATDLATAYALCAIVCGAAGGEGVHRVDGGDGDAIAFLLLRDVGA